MAYPRIADVVTTTSGQARGTRVADGVFGYFGISYAAEPFGANRFREPQPAPTWNGVRDAVGFGPIPPQPPPPLPDMPCWSENDGTEILTVNVWLPEQHDTAVPVLVWIFGSGYTSGAADAYDATELVQAGLVVVTFNYRVGVEGFGHVPGMPDNRGLLDQVAALRWVRENISAFGGDPDNVTIAGESAGAGCVAALAVMPAAAGLFHRGIAHSVPSEFLSVDAARSIGVRIADAAGVPYTAAVLAEIEPVLLVEAAMSVLDDFGEDPRSGIRHYLPTIFNPVVDGEVLPDTPLRAIGAGAASDIDLLFCHTADEFRLFTVPGWAPTVLTESDLAAVAAAAGLSARLLADYRAMVPDAAVSDVYAMIMTDFVFGEYTTRLAEAAARAGGASFLSRFAWHSPAFGGAVKACHAADLSFVFGDLTPKGGIAGMLLGDGMTDEDRALARRMSQCWARFAATGDPGWPALTEHQKPVRIWNRTDSIAAETATGLRALWAGIDYPPVEL
jgi:para-nitrobenzyl esterase